MFLMVLLWATPGFSRRLNVLRFDAHSVTVDLKIPVQPQVSSGEFVFAISSSPDELPLVEVRNSIGHEIHARPGARGTFQGTFVQWIHVTYRNLGIVGSEIDGRVFVSHEQPVYQAGGRAHVEGRLVRIPSASSLRKKSGVRPLPMPFTEAVRIEVSEDGIYALTGGDLRRAGIPLETIPSKTYRLYCRGTEIPLYVSDVYNPYLAESDSLLFYAEGLKEPNGRLTQYSDHNVYRLAWGQRSGLRIAEVSGAPLRNQRVYSDNARVPVSIEARHYADTLLFERDQYIPFLGDVYSFDLPPFESDAVDSNDAYYWKTVGLTEKSEVEFTLASPSHDVFDSARIRIGLRGRTTIPGTVEDHRFSILLNARSPGTGALEAVWDGQEEYIFQSPPFPSSFLAHGTNQVTFLRDDRGFRDLADLNWIEVVCVRGFQAYDNKVGFRINPRDLDSRVEFAISGFSTEDVDIWDIGGYRMFTNAASELDAVRNTYTFRLQDSISFPTRYIAQSVSLRRRPSVIRLDTIRNDWQELTGADYLMIAPHDMIEKLKPLEEVHESRGIRVERVALRDIYNAFADGIRNPEAIRRFLRYLFENAGDKKPAYLLLAGDATHGQYKLASERTFVPTHISNVPGWGPAADDGYFATVWGEDHFPDLRVGRMPARSGEELETMVSKTVGYITNPQPGYWRDNILTAGGWEEDFTRFNDRIARNIIGSRMNIIRMDADTASRYYVSPAMASRRMADYINSGVHVLNFAGHGGGLIWSDSRFFSYSDFHLLHNGQWGKGGRLPIVFSFTCLTGQFESLEYKSLGEEMYRYGKDGAAAFYGAAGYTRMGIDLKMNALLLDEMVQGNYQTLGELIAHTEALSLVLYGKEALPVIRQYNLLGDPALPLSLTPDTLAVQLEKSVLRGADTLVIRARTHPVVDGSAKVKVTAGNLTRHEGVTPVHDGSLEYRIPLKSGMHTSEGVVRVYAWNDSTEIRGWAPFSKDTILLHEVSIEPAVPTLGDSVEIRAILEDYEGPEQRSTLYCLYTIDYPSSQTLDFGRFPGISMVADTALGIRRLQRPILLGGDKSVFDPGMALLLKFRSEKGETGVYVFRLDGMADLAFDRPVLKFAWHDDSLNADFSVTNTGNETVSGYTYYLGWGGKSESFVSHRISEKLKPGSVHRYRVALPDTMGRVTVRAWVTPDTNENEWNSGNNAISGSFQLVYADVRTPEDSVVSLGGGCWVRPKDTLGTAVRFFLIDEKIVRECPLRNHNSRWVGVDPEGVRKFFGHTRPALTVSDTLVWNFQLQEPNAAKRTAPADTQVVTVFARDTAADRWKVVGGELKSGIVTLRSSRNQWFSPGATADTDPPHIRAYVGGREITVPDYVAKGKSFTILIADESGVEPESVRLYLNGRLLGDSECSEVAQAEDSSTVAVSAYPPPERDMDSLRVVARDFSGNVGEREFVYMPGEELRIRFFSCHPNPFKARTNARGAIEKVRFAFLLTDLADEVKLTVYTIGGRPVWRQSLSKVIGYHEIAWNGRTQTGGYRIANGTYYAKLEVSNEHKMVKEIIKIAKLEGY